MNSLAPWIVITALLGSALVGGIFFAFSSFVMKALARMPFAQGIAAMQSINVVVINPAVMGSFFGTALLSLGVAGVILFRDPSHPAAALFVAAALSYVVGTFLVTVIGNVPLNDQLAAVTDGDPSAAVMWRHYLKRWTVWNHIRTAAAMLAALLYTLGLLQSGVS